MSLEDLYKRDISRKDGDMRTAATGDLETVGLLANLRQALLHRLTTRKGSLVHRPNYGVSIQDYQGAPLSFERKRRLAVEIDSQFRRDPRVDRVSEVMIEEIPGQPYGVEVSTKVLVKGYGTASFEFAIGES